MSSEEQKNKENFADTIYKEYKYENGKVLRLTKEEFNQIVKAFLALHRQKQLVQKK